MTFSLEEKVELEKQGYANIGRSPKQTYYTPDGREIKCLPNMREYRDGNGGGVRDANLDRGWLLIKPTELKLTCPYCDLWHDAKEEVTKCGDKKNAFDAKWKKQTEKEQGDDRVDKLESQMGRIEGLLGKLLEGK